MRQAARLHAPYWDKPALHDIAWLQPTSSATAMVRQMLAPMYVQFRERYATRLAPEILAMGDAFVARAGAYFDIKPAVATIQHRDFRIDNILYSPDGARAHVVDWQTLGIGAGAADVAYLIGTSIADAAERAREEERLVRYYVDELGVLGAAPDVDTIWHEYKLYAFSGFLMAIIASMSVGRTERGDEMFAVMAERPALQVLHLDSLSLL
jgi:aminoglycoside phosphotransferase (APT) family kinase protein